MRKNIDITRFGKGELVKKKNKHKPKAIRFILIKLIFFAIVIAIFAYFFERNFLQYFFTKQYAENITVWIASLPSFWGGILGGIVGGSLSCYGIYITIKYYREKDIENHRLSVQPFILITLKPSQVRVNDELLFSFKNTPDHFVMCSLKNIGKGFAYILTYNDGSNFGGNKYIQALQSGESVDNFTFGVPNENGNYQLSLTYCDEFMNEYIQSFDITVKFEVFKVPDVTISPNFPQVIEESMK